MEITQTVMKSRNFAIVAAIAALLLATAAVSMATPENAFAYKKNQATSQTSACGNEFMPTNIGCQNTDSQIQGDENSVALTAQQTFPAIVQEEPIQPPPPPSTTCEECLELLISERAGLAQQLGTALTGAIYTSDEDAIAAICLALETGDITIEGLAEALAGLTPNLDLVAQIEACLELVFGVV